MVNNLTDLDRTFSALSDPTRRAILARLTRGPASVGELAGPFSISLPAISKHLRVLEKAGLITQRKEGRMRRCSLAAVPLEDAARWIESFRDFWEGRFDALAEHLDSEESLDAEDPQKQRRP